MRNKTRGLSAWEGLEMRFEHFQKQRFIHNMFYIRF